MAKRITKPRKGTPGPQAERLKIEGDWEAAAEKIVRAKKPVGGWPDPKRKSRKRPA